MVELSEQVPPFASRLVFLLDLVWENGPPHVAWHDVQELQLDIMQLTEEEENRIN